MYQIGSGFGVQGLGLKSWLAYWGFTGGKGTYHIRVIIYIYKSDIGNYLGHYIRIL